MFSVQLSPLGQKLKWSWLFFFEVLEFSLQGQVLAPGDKDKGQTAPLSSSIFLIFLPPWAHFSLLTPTAQICHQEKTQKEKARDWEHMCVPTCSLQCSWVTLSRPSLPQQHVWVCVCTYIHTHIHIISQWAQKWHSSPSSLSQGEIGLLTQHAFLNLVLFYRNKPSCQKSTL